MEPVQNEGSGGPGERSEEGRLTPLRRWWHTRVQQDLAAAAIGLGLFDFTPWADDLTDLTHWSHWHSVLHIAFGVGVYCRARQIAGGRGDDR